MKHLKYFEAKRKTPQELLTEYADDIVRVLPLYYNNYSTDSLHNQIDELIWECREADRLRGDDEVLSEEVVRQLLEDLNDLLLPRVRYIEKLLDIYYDCLPHTKHINKDKIEVLKEIFLDYSDDGGEISINKSSKFNDERYEVRLKLKDVFLKMNFEEVMSRVKEFMGIETYHITGTKDLITIEFIEFWKPLQK